MVSIESSFFIDHRFSDKQGIKGMEGRRQQC